MKDTRTWFVRPMMCALWVVAAQSFGAGAPDAPFQQEYHIPHAVGARPIHNDVRAITVDRNDSVWVATGAGAYRLDEGEAEWTACMTDSDAGPAFDVTTDNEGTVWVAAWNGLYQATPDGLRRVDRISGLIAAVCAVESGVACIGPDGLWRVSGETLSHERVDVARSVRNMRADPDGGLWIATENGLYHVAETGITLYRSEEELLTGSVSDVAYAPDGRLWIGGLGGVTVYDQGERSTSFTPGTVLPSVYVQSVAQAPDGAMWVGTRLGVTRYDGETWSLRHSSRWLLSDDVRDVAFDSRGTAWIATAGGVSAIERRSITLEEKARGFQEICMERHMREPGLVESCRLRIPGDLTTWKPDDDDNDGQYTAMYLAMESFRYAATQAPDARANAKKAFDALRFLQTVTDTDGFVARTVVPVSWNHMHDPNRTVSEREWSETRIGSPRDKKVEELWRPSADGQWLWKGDTSSDEITGHMYGYLFYHDLVADAAEREAVSTHVCKIVDHIIDGGYVFNDIDGTHTEWGVWSPEKLNHDPDWAAERGINSVEILSFLKLAHHMSGNNRYQEEYLSLLRDHDYGANVRNAKTYQLMWRTHIDDELLALAFPALLLYETDPKLQDLYRESLDHWYIGAKEDQSAFFNFIYASFSERDARLADSIMFLRDTPTDFVNWRIDNSQREDLGLIRAPEIEPLQTSRLPPPSERGVVRWDKNPWMAIQGDGGHSEWAPTSWLLPYWMGRHYGFIESPK